VPVRCHAGCGQRDVIAILRQRGFWETTRKSRGRFARKRHDRVSDEPDADAVKRSEAAKCPLWPFRAGKHPWRAEARKTPLTDANSDRQSTFQDEGLPSC
jgi:hypothetical protein